jgi:hypothetical protein
MSVELIPVTPVEYSDRKITRYFGYRIQEFSAADLKEAIEGFNLQQEPEIRQEANLIFYQYPGYPPIVIQDGQLFVTKEEWTRRGFSHKKIRHQASILLRLLHRAGLASYHRKAIPKKDFTPHKWRKN